MPGLWRKSTCPKPMKGVNSEEEQQRSVCRPNTRSQSRKVHLQDLFEKMKVFSLATHPRKMSFLSCQMIKTDTQILIITHQSLPPIKDLTLMLLMKSQHQQIPIYTATLLVNLEEITTERCHSAFYVCYGFILNVLIPLIHSLSGHVITVVVFPKQLSL